MAEEGKRVARFVRFAPAMWAALEAEAARQNRSVSNLLETMAKEAMRNG